MLVGFVGMGLIGVICLFLINMYQKESSSTLPNNGLSAQSDNLIEGSKTDIVSSETSEISYANALVKYKDRRIQFDKTCQAFPNTITYNDNLGIMLDNRSPDTRTIKVGTVYTIKGYGFKIIKLADVSLNVDKTFLVDCDARQNVATVLVQD